MWSVWTVEVRMTYLAGGHTITWSAVPSSVDGR
jgi:hypothetical protein